MIALSIGMMLIFSAKFLSIFCLGSYDCNIKNSKYSSIFIWHSIFFSKDNRLKIGGIFQFNVHTARILGAHIIKNDALI